MAKRSRNLLAGLDAARVDLGRVVAEQDRSLLEYYVSPERYVHRALDFNDPSAFFIGTKGAGKSAILQMVRLSKDNDAKRIIDISPDDLAFTALANVQADTPLLRASDKNQWLFKSLWDYVLSLEIIRREAPSGDWKSKLKNLVPWGETRQLKRLLDISLADDGTRRTLTSKILQLVKEVELNMDVPESIGGTATVRLNKDASKSDALPLLSQVNQVAKRLSDSLKTPYWILIDDLDLHWNGSPTQTAFIAALFLSLRSFSKPPWLKCVVAMRDDIYRVLPLEDKDKTRDSICYVNWDQASVKGMISKRINVRLGVRPEEIWTKLFESFAFELL